MCEVSTQHPYSSDSMWMFLFAMFTFPSRVDWYLASLLSSFFYVDGDDESCWSWWSFWYTFLDYRSWVWPEREKGMLLAPHHPRHRRKKRWTRTQYTTPMDDLEFYPKRWGLLSGIQVCMASLLLLSVIRQRSAGISRQEITFPTKVKEQFTLPLLPEVYTSDSEDMPGIGDEDMEHVVVEAAADAVNNEDEDDNDDPLPQVIIDNEPEQPNRMMSHNAAMAEFTAALQLQDHFRSHADFHEGVERFNQQCDTMQRVLMDSARNISSDKEGLCQLCRRRGPFGRFCAHCSVNGLNGVHCIETPEDIRDHQRHHKDNDEDDADIGPSYPWCAMSMTGNIRDVTVMFNEHSEDMKEILWDTGASLCIQMTPRTLMVQSNRYLQTRYA